MSLISELIANGAETGEKEGMKGKEEEVGTFPGKFFLSNLVCAEKV